MDQITVTFDRVFDIVRNSRRWGGRYTEFGFQSGELKKYAVAAPDSPRIEPGMTVTAVLRRPGDWQSLMGWVDHQTGEVAYKHVTSEVGGFLGAVVAGCCVYVLAASYPFLAGLALIVAICLFAGSIVGIRNAIAAKKVLNAVKSTLNDGVACR